MASEQDPFKKLTNYFTFSDEDPKGGDEEVEDFCCGNLSYETRMTLFLLFFVLGWFFVLFSPVWSGGIWGFALIYTLGNVCATSSGFFLWGPKTQIKYMFADHRRNATMVYLTCLGLMLLLVICSAGQKEISGFTFFFIYVLMFCQVCASIWYSASYIPWGRSLLSRMLKSITSSIGSCVWEIQDEVRWRMGMNKEKSETVDV